MQMSRIPAADRERLTESQIGAEAERVDHHPDLDLRYAHVDVTLVSHDVGGVTRRDIRLAGTISEIAARLEAPAQPDDIVG